MVINGEQEHIYYLCEDRIEKAVPSDFSPAQSVLILVADRILYIRRMQTSSMDSYNLKLLLVECSSNYTRHQIACSNTYVVIKCI